MGALKQGKDLPFLETYCCLLSIPPTAVARCTVNALFFASELFSHCDNQSLGPQGPFEEYFDASCSSVENLTGQKHFYACVRRTGADILLARVS